MPASLEDILTHAIEGKTPDSAVAAAAPAAVSAPMVAAPADALHLSPEKGSANGIDWLACYESIVPAGTLTAEDRARHDGSAGVATAAAAAIATTAAVAATATTATTATTASISPARAAEAVRTIQAPVKEDSIRVDAVKLDALLEVAGESVQAANQAAVLLEKLGQFQFEGGAAALMAALSETLNRASRYSTELQRATLSTRMQPVGRLFQKFPRLVRELAKDLGKDVELVIEGAETEVDRVVVDSLYDPLVHMLRNALDHGIEENAVRAASGKNLRSIISLKAWQEASSVMIELSDDGKGMDPQELRRKAIAKGLISESAAQTNDEAFQLVFLPGFSTKEVANSVSGRGVGMDVVKTAVEKHRGSIRIDSTLGAGTRFSIRLPIELSIVPTMLVRTAGAALAMPMAVVQRVVELPAVFAEIGGAPVLRDQGRPLPVLSLAAVLGYEPCSERVGIVIASANPYILAVEAVDGTADLVIKPMTALSVPGIAGTARSAEGELVLVIGLSFLLAGCNATDRLAA